ncbi:MAG: hypothetical protein EZS28_037558 [Streblomastix strix]|uniref:Uncharacterized protein n=1 Tax=Streblomastix strix TaxID=222440 RepID=A0A5J4UBB6_9EUKA|nr:MAG: hypothetical protein EZS28_037558 [Streblomastix strix]
MNDCRFVSSIDGMSTVTGSSFVKSGADDTVVLLGASGTKPLSEFVGTPTDLSNYYTKEQTFSQTEANNKFVRLEKVDAKLTNVVTTNTTQSISGAKTFNANVSATGFMKAGKDDTSVLLAGGGDRLQSSFGEIEDLTSSAFSMIDDTAVTTYIPFPNHTVDKGDEALLDAAGLSEFPELYAYIHEREPKPIVDGIANQIIVGPQYLQD